MSEETPTKAGTIQEAQSKILNLMNAAETEESEEVEETEESISPDPEEPIEETQEELPEEDGDDYTDEDEEPERTFKLKVDGEEIEVNEEELLKGYSRQSDYSKKTQEISEQRKGLDLITQETNVARERMSQLIPELENHLLQVKETLNAEPNWDVLYKQDPVKAQRIERDFNRRKDQNKAELERLAILGQQTKAENEAEAVRKESEHLAEQGKLMINNIPEWKDDKVALAEKGKIEEWALNNSFYDKERIASIKDWGTVAVLRKAWLFDQGKTAVKKAKAKSSKTLTPGSKKRSAPTRNAVRDQRARLKKSGDTKDAQALIEMALNSESRRR